MIPGAGAGYPSNVRLRGIPVLLLLLAGCRHRTLTTDRAADAAVSVDTGGAGGGPGRGDALVAADVPVAADAPVATDAPAGADGPADANAAGDAPGCVDNADCDPTLEFCRKSCAADAPGACVPRPGMRETSFCVPGGDPVCGCDGKTYGYDCLANAAGVNVASTGACPLPDGGGAPCATNDDCAAMGAYYCQRAACADATGTCQPKPEYVACQSQSQELICGCDHVTYPSPCEAASYGASIDSVGACPPPPSGPCTSQADCGGASYAPLVFCKPTACGQPAGLCTRRPGACPVLGEAVCGCNNKTYGSSCTADGAAVGTAYEGPCRSGQINACDATNPCAATDVCIPDPRPCAPGAACPNVCVRAIGSGCGLFAAPDGGPPTNLGCLFGKCVADGSQGCATAGACGTCIAASPRTCDDATPCIVGELCVPTIGCATPPCPSVCVFP